MLTKKSKKVKKSQREIDEEFMRIAYRQAERALEEGEVPVGAILVHKEKVIAKAYNQVELLQDATAHAEIILISSASDYINSKYLKDCTLYVTLEPCSMCAGAIGWAQVSRLVFGAEDKEKGYRIKAPTVLHPKCKVSYDVLGDKCKELLDEFFASKRK